MINNRQAGRRRGRGNNTGNPRPNGGQGRGDSANRIDNRARGNAAQLYEKYKNLASDAQRQGDRVNIEYYLQFADHYFRVLNDQRLRQEENQPRRQYQSNDTDDDTNDDDFGNEGDPIRPGEQDSRQPERERQGSRRNGRGDDDRQAQEASPSEDEDRQRGRRNGRASAVRENTPDEAPVAAASEMPAEDQPSRRARPRRSRNAEGDAPALEADRLPPSLSTAEPSEEKPRRRRTRVAAADESTPAT